MEELTTNLTETMDNIESVEEIEELGEKVYSELEEQIAEKQANTALAAVIIIGAGTAMYFGIKKYLSWKSRKKSKKVDNIVETVEENVDVDDTSNDDLCEF